MRPNEDVGTQGQSYLNSWISWFGQGSATGRFLNYYKDSIFNVVSGRGLSTGRFYEFHSRLHGMPAFGRRAAQGMKLFKGEPWKASANPLQPYGRLGYIFNAPPALYGFGVGMAGTSALSFYYYYRK